MLSGFFENIYYALSMYFWLMLSVLGICLVIIGVIFVLEWLFPKDVHLLNYALTDKTFNELYKNHHYHAAVFIAENDNTYINDDPYDMPNKDMLRDCYLHVGEYSKAEKIGMEILNLNPDISEEPAEQQEFAKLALDCTHAVAARDLFRLYEKMGDRNKQLEMYKILKKFYDSNRFHGMEQLMESQGLSLSLLDKENANFYTIEHNLKYDVICGLHLENPDAAIDSLKNYISKVMPLAKFKPSLKLTFINRLLSWYLERNELFKAQSTLINGIEIVKILDTSYDELTPLGDFAEYCYKLHDIKNAIRFMNIYMRYMNDNYDDGDLEYLLAEMRFIKYKKDFSPSVIDDLSHCCRGLRDVISKNLAGMTIDQQDYFAKELNEPFSYALSLLEKMPHNEKLVDLCFENEVFKRGLLLRSDVMIRRALSETNDSTLINDYDRYISLKRELIAREEIVGPGNFARKMYLQSKVSDLEKELSVQCAEFARNKTVNVDISDIKSSLTKDQGLITYVEMPQSMGTALGAFVLTKRDGLSFFKLCSSQEENSIANTDVLETCVDTKSYELLFSKFENLVSKSRTILYSPAGIMHRIPLPALYVNDTKTLSDYHSFQIIANPIDLAYDKDKNISLEKMNVALWGGIDYGMDSIESTQEIQTRAVMRGQTLNDLIGSKKEVSHIVEVLNGKVRKATPFMGTGATERSFKTESGSANIIHISTHGFFTEDKEHGVKNAMHNSGLFFANANAAWKDDVKQTYFKNEYEDGILRADEIETLDLTSCALVVLSACETGLGEIKEDEGVYGLQRAFKLAGTKYILMSLWSVPDAATEDLMVRFYSYLVKKQNVYEAFSNAQKDMRESTNPTYGIQDWGGFVLLH